MQQILDDHIRDPSSNPLYETKDNKIGNYIERMISYNGKYGLIVAYLKMIFDFVQIKPTEGLVEIRNICLLDYYLSKVMIWFEFR